MDQKLNLATLGTTFWVCFSILESPYLYFCVLMLLHMMLVVDESSIGQSKAKCVCASLQELNNAVKAKFIEEYPETLIETNPSFFSQFTLVIATQVWIDGAHV